MTRKTRKELERDIAEALSQPTEPRRRDSVSDFHRANVPPHLWEDLNATGAVVRKVERATKVTEGRSTTYYYRGINIDQDLSVPSGYYGRWKARGFTEDSLSHLLAAIDAAGSGRRQSHVSKPPVLRLKKVTGGWTARWGGHTYHLFRERTEYGDYQWIVDRDDGRGRVEAPWIQTDTLREAKATIAAAGSPSLGGKSAP